MSGQNKSSPDMNTQSRNCIRLVAQTFVAFKFPRIAWQLTHYDLATINGSTDLVNSDSGKGLLPEGTKLSWSNGDTSSWKGNEMSLVILHVNSLIQDTHNNEIWMFLVSSSSCFCPIHWRQVLSWEWRCTWSSTDRRCSNYISAINNFIAY